VIFRARDRGHNLPGGATTLPCFGWRWRQLSELI
jgi:hypothetical protein